MLEGTGDPVQTPAGQADDNLAPWPRFVQISIANRARAGGATEAEIREAVRIACHFGGVPALVSALEAYPKE